MSSRKEEMQKYANESEQKILALVSEIISNSPELLSSWVKPRALDAISDLKADMFDIAIMDADMADSEIAYSLKRIPNDGQFGAEA